MGGPPLRIGPCPVNSEGMGSHAATMPHDSPKEGQAAGLERGLLAGEGPVEPGHQRLDVGGLDGRAAPDAQAGRRVAIAARCRRRPSLLEQRDDALGEGLLAGVVEAGDRRIDDAQADRGVGARVRDRRQEVDRPGSVDDPVGDHLGVGVGARDQRVEAADRLRPLQRVDIVLDAEHRRRVDRLALEDALDQLAARRSGGRSSAAARRACSSPAARRRAG